MYDCMALGEVMLRFDPGDGRMSTANSFTVWEGGGEYNVVRGLSSCFARKTAVVTALVDNGIGNLIRNRIGAGGVDTGLIRWFPDDGIGEACRNGIYFLEKGFGMRPALGVSDRGHSAISQLEPHDIDWRRLFAAYPTRWFHTGGIMAGLSARSAAVVREAVEAAKDAGATVSYDLNYRPSLWRRLGGKAAAAAVNHTILPHVDVLFGVDELQRAPRGLESEVFAEAIHRTADRYPNLQTICTTMRCVHTASRNDWSGMLLHQGNLYQGPKLENLEIYDRVGGGDSFAAGIIYGLLQGLGGQKAIDYAVWHGALTMTTPGDNSMTTLEELDRCLASGDAGVNR